jgi:hypothetical protein
MNTVEIILDLGTKNPAAVDEALNQIGAALIEKGGKGDYERTPEGYYVARCFGSPEFIRFACENQGYAKVVGEREIPR